MSRTIHEILDEYMEHVELVKQKMQYTMLENIFCTKFDEEKVSKTQEPDYPYKETAGEIRLRKFGFKIEIPNDYEDDQSSVFANTKIDYKTLFVEKESTAVINSTAAEKALAYINPQTVAAYTVTKDEITFNGSPIADVISYDEKTGEVHYYERHWSTGDLIPDGTDPTGNRTAKSKGTVKVVKKYSNPSTNYPGYSGDTGCGLDLNADPNGQCGIDPNYKSWCPYGQVS